MTAINRLPSGGPLLLVLLLLGRLTDCQAQEGLTEAMWNITSGLRVSTNPHDAGCDASLPASYCIPKFESINQISSLTCARRECRPENADIKTLTDGNARAAFVSRDLKNEPLELIANLEGVFNIFHFFLTFSGNPPDRIVIDRKLDPSQQTWSPWRLFALNCSTAFGIRQYQAPGVLSESGDPAGSVQCSNLPWKIESFSPLSFVAWNILLDRPLAFALDQTDNPLFDQLTRAASVRISLSGHLIELPESSTTYGYNSYSVNEIRIFGRCASGFHRVAGKSNGCQRCDCHRFGSINQTCSTQGICTCKTLFTGSKCSDCSLGYFNSSAGCIPCDCDALGTGGDGCDADSGVCRCRAGFSGTRCDNCPRGSYLLGRVCTPCGCNLSGTTEDRCTGSGACLCKASVTGVKCDVCRDGYTDLSGSNPNGCTPRSVPVLHLAAPEQPNRSLNNRDLVQFNASNNITAEMEMGNNTINASSTNSSHNASDNASSTVLPGMLVIRPFDAVTHSSSVVDGSVVYPWLIAITVLLIIALLIALVHFIFYLRRRSWQKTYVPRQVPEFLAVDPATKHPDYARKRPERTSAKLTGYFYNPDYAIGALTPGLQGRRGTNTNRNDGEYDADPGNRDFDDDDAVNNNPASRGRRPIDLTREPAPTGLMSLRPHGQSNQRTINNQPLSTISGGIVNENFNQSDEI
ncbi:putative Laminin subunit gamma-1 [Hypsibius exemplaris]|uniref:Laminin subunit gamma-1 n=1 Tax=Hypsibius exemplaris TaxID=2072580 RepID=A0A1W0WUW4_HYPEX|nr:putative Laminin subunit gamma-1 [Hypsibius exemplaris]